MEEIGDIEFKNWDDVKSELLERLGFCGCGLPDDALQLIHDLIEFIDGRFNKECNASAGSDKWKSHCDDMRASLRKVLHDNMSGIEYVLFYLLDNKEITEHGGCVPGFIVDKEFMNTLKSYINHINGND